MRPATLADAEAVVALFNTCTIEQAGVPLHDLNELKTDWEDPQFNLETDSRVVIAPDGTLAGAMHLWDRDPHVRVYAQGYVHPDYQGQGIGSALCAWSEMRTQQAISRAPEGTRVVMVQGILTTDAAAQALLEARGYQTVRYFSRMIIEMAELPPEPVPPEGIVIRPFIRGKEERAMILAERESFRDHWGFVEHPLEETYETWMHLLDNNPDIDPKLWFAAVDGEEIAGLLVCFPKTPEDPEMAYVDTLGVRRAWRRRGLGLAMLQHAFRACYERGKHKVALEVDSSSLTGATRLYEKAGMHVQRQEVNYEKELRPGKDLSTQTLEA